MKSTKDRPTAPKTNSMEKEPANGCSSNKGKRTTWSSSLLSSPKATPWFLEEHYEGFYKYNYAKMELIQPKFLNMEWLKTQGFVFSELLEYHGLNKLIGMKGTFYPSW